MQKDMGSYSFKHTFPDLYVSIVDVYKHQRHVAEALANLREKGFPVQLDLIGSVYPPDLKQMGRIR